MFKYLLILFVLATTKAPAQTFEQNFLGDEFLFYKGVLLKLTDNSTSNFNLAFYSDIKYCQSGYDRNVIYQDKNHNSQTEKDSLANRIFIVENIVDKTGKDWNETTPISRLDQPIFILKDKLRGQIIYFRYDKDHEGDFPFKTSKINYPADYYCSQIERIKDEFTNELKFYTPSMMDGEISPVSIVKVIDKGKSVYYLSLNTIGSSVNVSKKGVIILFEDGTKWTRNEKIDVDAGSDGFEYSAFITLSPTDLTTFSTKKIKKFRLYVYDQEVNSKNAERFKMFTGCIRAAK